MSESTACHLVLSSRVSTPSTLFCVILRAPQVITTLKPPPTPALVESLAHDQPAPQPERVLLRIPIQVIARGPDNVDVSESTNTVVVSAPRRAHLLESARKPRTSAHVVKPPSQNFSPRCWSFKHLQPEHTKP